MAQSICLVVSAGDRARLEAIVADRNRPQKQVARARLVLLSADRLDVATVARQAGISRPAVWRWQQRYAETGVDGLLRDKTRKPGKAPLSEALVRRVVALTCAEPPGQVTHWTGRAMAAAVGVSLRAVQRIWAAHKLQPHRLRSFKRSRDPDFLAKLTAIVGLYMAPPRHAVVLSLDEKSQIQALDRTQPGLPIKPGKCATMTHDYKRNGTTTLFAALNVLDGTVLGRCMQRHRHQEFQFRKLSFATNMTGLKGVDPEGSQRAWDLYVKSRWIAREQPARALVMASGTPITNTLGEMFSLQRFMHRRCWRSAACTSSTPGPPASA